MSADTDDARPLPADDAPVEFHDDRPDDKAVRGSWSDWRNRPDWNLDSVGRQLRPGA